MATSPLFTDFAKDIVLGVLQSFFQQREDFRWDEDQKTTDIMIVDKFTVNLESVVSENKPAIVANRGPMSWRNRTIDQFTGTLPGPSNAKQYSDLLDTTFVLSCISRAGLEAEALASLVFGVFTFFKQEIRGTKGVHDVRSAQIGVEQLGRTDSDIEMSVVPVTISLSLNRSWSLEETNAPLFNSVSVNTNMFTKSLEQAKQWDLFQRTLRTTI